MSVFVNEVNGKVMFVVSSEDFEEESMVEQVALVMNIVPCRELRLRCKS